MIGLFKKKPAAPAASPQPQPGSLVLQMREMLFGDMPLHLFPPPDAQPVDAPPWGPLAAAREAIVAGRHAEAEQHCRRLLSAPQESRVIAQTWQTLRGIGIAPQGDEIQVVGAVAEAGVNGGLDIVAAYRDGTARYYNYSGAAVVWESPDADAAIADTIRRLITAAEKIASFAGVHDAARPGPPPQGQVRLTAIVTDGLHFGQAPMEIFQRDAVAGPFLSEAVQLMQLLMEAGRAG
jgi:hypothetical protein